MESKKSNRGGKRANAGRKPKSDAPASTATSAPKNARWLPGQSGNPSGRPKVVAEVRELARSYTNEAIETLATIMRNPQAASAARVSAASAILDRGYGKPQQHIVNAIRDARRLSDDELYIFLDEEQRGAGAFDPPAGSGSTH